MKTILKSTPFWIGLAVATALWSLGWPGHSAGAAPVSPAGPPAKLIPWSMEQIADHITAANTAETNERKFQAAVELSGIPIGQVKEALESIPIRKFKISPAESTLLIRWASKDGGATADWAWQRYGKAGMWHIVFPEIGPGWAWQDPKGFAAWVKDHVEPQGAFMDQQVKMASETPVLETRQFCDACAWLAPGDTYAAYDLAASRPGLIATDLSDIAKTLRSVSQVREGLLAFKDLDQLRTSKLTPDQLIPMSLLARWQELDPEDFSRSSYQHLMAAAAFGGIDPMIQAWRTASTDDQRTTRAARFLEEKSGKDRAHAITLMANEWAGVDPAGASRWLESLPDEEIKISVFATGIAPRDFETALRYFEKQPPLIFQSALVRSFDAWRKVHPEESPDISRLDDHHRRIWEDLEALGAP